MINREIRRVYNISTLYIYIYICLFIYLISVQIVDGSLLVLQHLRHSIAPEAYDTFQMAAPKVFAVTGLQGVKVLEDHQK